jgi:hypothetical protein
VNVGCALVLGGVVVYAGDPGLGIALVPLGALLLLLAAYQLVRAVQRGVGR